MVHVTPLVIGSHTFIGVSVSLPKTNLLSVSSEKGYIMCGALDIGFLNRKLSDRKIIAGKAVGVRNLLELIDAPLESVTEEARNLGITPGMLGRDALIKMV